MWKWWKKKEKTKKEKKRKEHFRKFSLGEEIEEDLTMGRQGKTLEELQLQLVKMEKREMKTPEELQQYLDDCQEQMESTNRRLKELKQEYQAVNRYLTDIHLIEHMPEPHAGELVKLAKSVVVLEKDRKEYGQSVSKLSGAEYHRMREYEEDIQDVLKTMSEDEKYCETVKTDMRYLEGERSALTFEKKELSKRLYLLKGMTKIGVIAFAAVLVFLLVLQFGYQFAVEYFMYGMIVVGIIFTAVIFILNNRTTLELRRTDEKINKAVVLLNKVKLKYVNVVTRLEYAYEKYDVKSAIQLNKRWGNYLQLKREHEVYKKATTKLIEAEEELEKLLQFFDIKDTSIWVRQAYALVDRGELEELKQSLLHRRYQLKDAMTRSQDVLLKMKKELQTELSLGNI